MYILNPPEQEAIDSHWAELLGPLLIATGETFEALMPPQARLREQYVRFRRSEHADIPDLHPEITNGAELLLVRDKLMSLDQDIARHETNSNIHKAYAARIAETIANVDMILAASQKDDDTFRHSNQRLYGMPDRTVFEASCAWLRQEAEQAMISQYNLAPLCEKVLQLVPALSGDPAILFPDPQTFASVRSLHFAPGGYMDQLFGAPVSLPDSMVTPASGDALTRSAMNNVGSDFAIHESAVGLWSVLQSRRQVVRPAEYNLTRQAFLGILSHEVGSHLLESVNGNRSKLRLLELGMGGYEKSNEGRAFLREQIMYDRIEEYVYQDSWSPHKASWEYRVTIHLVLSLAAGLHGRRYDFAELYQLVCALFRFWSVQRGMDPDAETISKDAWDLVVRALKGTDGRGGAYYKDIVYLEGNINCWKAAKSWPELILYGDLGKFDIANTEHVMILKELGILPTNQ